VFTRATDKISCLFPSNRESSIRPWYSAGGKMSDKNLEQRLNMKFCVKTGVSATETSALTWAYAEYAMKKLNVFEWHRWFKEG
jgi:hypothetical protein